MCQEKISKIDFNASKHYQILGLIKRHFQTPKTRRKLSLSDQKRSGILGVMLRYLNVPHSEYCHIFTEPQQELYKDVQMIALHGHIPDSYMWALLKLARTCDAFQASTAPILEHQFDYKDNLRAIANIDKLVMMEDSRSKLKEKKYKRQTGNFDDLFNLDS